MIKFFAVALLIDSFSVFVFWCMWSWFLVPLGFPIISFWLAFALHQLIKFLTTDSEESNKEWTDNVIHHISRNTVCLLIALILSYITQMQ